MAKAMARVEHGQRRRLGDLSPHPKNSRLHSEEQVTQIAASMTEWDWTIPMLVDEAGVILAGHGRREAGLKKFGPDYEVPVSVAVGWTEIQKRAYVIADNRLTELATWDYPVLRAEMKALDIGHFDLKLTGFSITDLLPLEPEENPLRVRLADKFGVPPFSVLNAREGWWQDRKRAWLSLGIQSELGRGETEADASFKNQGAQRALQDGPSRKARHNANAANGGSPLPMDRAKKRKANATPGGAAMPATNYSRSRARGDGRGRPIDQKT